MGQSARRGGRGTVRGVPAGQLRLHWRGRLCCGRAWLVPCTLTPAWNKPSCIFSFTLVFYYNCIEWDHSAKRVSHFLNQHELQYKAE